MYNKYLKGLNNMFKDVIKKLREDKGLTQEELGQILGVQGGTIGNYEQGQRLPKDDKMWIKIAKYFNVSVDYLMDVSDTPQIIAADTSNIDGKPTIIAQNPDFVHYDNIYPIELKKFPLLGSVACGEPIYSPEDTDVYIMANADIKADFVLKAKGDSMINARIYDGDIVFIKAQPVVELGEVAAVAIDNEVTLKRTYYYPNKGKLILNPENPAYEPMVFMGSELNSIRILGKAVAFQSTVK